MKYKISYDRHAPVGTVVMEFGIGVSRLESAAVVALGMAVYLNGVIERRKCISSGVGFYA